MTSSPVSSTCTPPGHTSARAARGEEAARPRHHVVEVARLVAALVHERVAVHRVARPHDRVTGVAAPRAAAAAACSATWSAPMRLTSVSRPGSRPGSSRSAQRDDVVGRRRRARASRRSGSARPERNSTCAPSSWRVRSPIQSRCAEQSYQSPVRLSRAGERLLVAEQQRLVRRVEVDLVQLRLGVEVDAARGHEAQRPLDLVGELRRSAGPRGSRRRTRGSTGARGARSAKPPLVNARSRLSVAAAWW